MKLQEHLNPDHGSGRPGSMLWHTLKVKECKTLSELNDYVYSVVGSYISLDALKTVAIGMVEEFKNGKGK